MSLLDTNLSSIPLRLFQVNLKNIVKYTNETVFEGWKISTPYIMAISTKRAI